jgi:hypothetical protein
MRLKEVSGLKEVRSECLRTLESKLGFGKDFPGRDTKSFRASLTDFRIAFEVHVKPLDYMDATSPEAYKCATSFCDKNSCAEKFWPSTGIHDNIPKWSTDKVKES